jgi:Ferritin-like domain
MTTNHPTSPNDVQVLENVLKDTPTDGFTRRTLLRRAAITAAAASVAAPTEVLARSSSSDVTQIINTAITAEALAVTYLSGLIEHASATGVTKFVPVLKAANAAEYDHYKALKSLGAKPLTTKFWAPDAFFRPGQPFKVLELAETLFVDAYLIATTTFAQANKPSLARYAGEIGGVEAQHLALVRFAKKELPNDRAFQAYTIPSISGVVAALEKAGVGFGKPGAKPGKFYSFSPPPASAVTAIQNNAPK